MSHSDDIMPPGSRSCLLLSFLFFSFWLHYTWLLHAKTPSRWEAKDSVQTVSRGPVWWVITDPPPRWKPPTPAIVQIEELYFTHRCRRVGIEVVIRWKFAKTATSWIATWSVWSRIMKSHIHVHTHSIHSCPYINICWRKPFRALLKNDYV